MNVLTLNLRSALQKARPRIKKRQKHKLEDVAEAASSSPNIDASLPTTAAASTEPADAPTPIEEPPLEKRRILEQSILPVTTQDPSGTDRPTFNEKWGTVPLFQKAIKLFEETHKELSAAIYKTTSPTELACRPETCDQEAPKGLQNPPPEIQSFIQRCKPYLPSLSAVQGWAMTLSRLDPHGIAPLVVNSVFFVVQLSIGSVDPELREKTLTILSKASITMNKWVAYEYAQHQTLAAPNSKDMDCLEDELLKLYVQSLETIGLIFQRFEKCGPNFISQSHMPEIERKLSELDRIDKGCTSIKDEIDADLKSKETVGKLIRWIKDENDPEPSHEGFLEQTGLQDDTLAADWFLRTSEFTLFEEKLAQDHEGQIIRLNGMMGSGKTTLICRVISHFQRFPIPGLRIVHYYCYGSTASDGAPGISYQTVIRGLCSKMAWNNDSGKLSQSARDLYRKCHPTEGDRKPTDGEWKQLLKDLVTESKTLLIVDALDECRFPDHNDFLKSIRDLWKHQRLNVIFSSRPQIDVKRYFGEKFVDYQVATTEATDDMGRFIEKKISEIKEDPFRSNSILFKKDYLSKRLVEALNKHAGSMFRWVEVWLGVLLPHDPIAQSDVAKSKLEILECALTLKNLSNQANMMNHAYQQLWETNARDERRRRHQIRMFQFVLGALEPITPQVLLEAICFDPEQPTRYDCELEIDYIEKLYHNFLSAKGGVLSFEHVSAKAFILELGGQENKTSLFANEALNHGVIARTSLLLLQYPEHPIWVKSGIDWSKLPFALNQHEFRRRRSLDRRSTFYDPWDGPVDDGNKDRITCLGTYIIGKWYKHCSWLRKNDLDLELSQELPHLLLDILAHFPTPFKCLSYPKRRSYLDNDHWVWKDNFNHCLVRANNQLMVDPLMFTLAFHIFPSHCGDKLKDLAVTLGTVMVRNLKGKTALHIAVQQPDLHSVRALLDISLQLNQGREFLMAQNLEGETALHIAVRENSLHSVEALLKISLEKGFGKEFLYAKANRGENALHFSGGDAVVRVLLQFEEEIAPSAATPGTTSCRERLIESKDIQGTRPMIPIMEKCSEELVLFIFADPYAAFIDLPKTTRVRLLALATERNFKKVARFFLSQDADITSVYSDQGTALTIASSDNRVDLAELQLDQSADTEAIGGRYGTALAAAASKGHLDMANLLVTRGANINIVARECGTALGVAAWHGHLEMAELLMERNANIDAIDGKYGTALGVAAWQGHLKMANLLVTRGADANAIGGDYGTALGVAAWQGHIKMAELLMERNANVDVISGKYGSALTAATWQGHLEMARLLIERGANINAIGGNYSTALEVAASNGHFEIAKLLVERGANINAISGDYSTALEAAAFNGHVEVAKLLVDRGADVNAIGGKYGTVLGAAAWKGQSEIAKFLVDQGADIDAAVGEYGTALMIAAFKNHLRFMGLLLRKGANANAVGGLYGTALGASVSQNLDKPLVYLQMYHVDIGLAIREWPSEGHWARSGQRCKPIADAWVRYQPNSGNMVVAANSPR